MAKFYDRLNDETRDFITRQKIFFVATAPDEGRISLSPKGMDTLRVLDDTRVAYMDLTGSGSETSAHVRQNARMTMMFCSFEEKPLILRLYGRGEVVRPSDAGWADMRPHFPVTVGDRQIIILNIDSLQTSCGFSIPFFDYRGERPMLEEWAQKKGEEGVRAYWEQKNRVSIDGLPTGVVEPESEAG